jgi:hypothetical protein
MCTKAIQTKYLAPTKTKPARIKAWALGVEPIYIPYKKHRVETTIHGRAALVLLKSLRKYGWGDALIASILPDGKGYVFVLTPGADIYIDNSVRVAARRRLAQLKKIVDNRKIIV